MKTFYQSIKKALSPTSKNIISVFSLTLGLTLSLVLFGSVVYQKSFDNFHSKKDRIYLLKLNFQDKDGDRVSGRVPNIVTTAIGAEVPEVEIATQFNSRSYEYSVNNESFELNQLRVDSLFFDVFSFEVLQGNPREDFKDPYSVYLSKSKAKELFGNLNPIGQMINKGNQVFTIKGIFDNFPSNTIITSKFGSIDIIESMSSIKVRDSWFFGSSYYGVIVVKEGISKELAENKIQELMKNKIGKNDLSTMNRIGVNIQYTLLPLADEHSNSQLVNQTSIIISFIALLFIIISALNFSLISLSSISLRLKEIGVHRCYGAKKGKIVRMILTEISIQVLTALGMSILLIFAFKHQISSFFAPINVIFTFENIWGAIIVVILIMLFASIIPSLIFSNISVVSLFGSIKNNNQLWKKAMLFTLIFFTISFLSVILISIKQYDYILNKNIGYDYENLVYTELNIKGEYELDKYIQTLEKLNCIDKVTYSSNLLMHPMPGFSASNDLGDNELRYVMYFEVLPNFFDVHKIDFFEGDGFESESDLTEVIVNRQFIKMMGWKDSQTTFGRYFNLDGTMCRIVAVVNDFESTDQIAELTYRPIAIKSLRPTIKPKPGRMTRVILIAKMTNISHENINAIGNAIRKVDPNYEGEMQYLGEYRKSLMVDFKKQIDGIKISSSIILLILIMGLYGYITNELQFKYREIALRKVYGASIPSIIRMTYKPIALLLVLTIPLSVLASYYAGSMLLERNYADTAEISWWIFVISILFVLFVSLAIVSASTIKIAIRNPVSALYK